MKRLLLLSNNKAMVDQSILNIFKDRSFEIRNVNTDKMGYEDFKNKMVVMIADGDYKNKEYENLIHSIRNAANTSYIPRPLIIMVATFQLQRMAYAVEKGFDEFIAKPLKQDHIRILIDKYLDGQCN